MANHVTVEDDQVFLERLFEEQQDQMALEGDQAGGVGDHYGDTRARAGGSSSRLVSSLLRNVHTAESSLSTVSDVVDTGAAGLSDDGGGDELDRQDAPGDMPLPPPARRAQTQAGAAAFSHRRTDSDDGGFGGPVDRAGGRQSQQSPQAPAQDAAAASLRRKLTTGAGSGVAAAAPGEAGASASNEELTSFFQNLLGRKGGASSSAGSSGKDSPQQPARSLTGSLSRATGAGKKVIQADLERWKAQLKRQKE
ncbi:hypothetical protein IWQ56_005492 [Coemansia nantahalensis]|nr:hypothetical protein IWQ56_005492 [Coemansia nantahalensis]